MIVRHTTMIIFFIVSLISAPKIFAENVAPDALHEHSQSMRKDPQVPQPATDNRIQALEHRLQESINKYDAMTRDIERQSDKYKDMVEIHNQSANTGSSLASTMQIISILVAIISAVLLVILTYFSPQYFRKLRNMKQAVKQVVKRADIKQQLNFLMSRIELGILQQELGRSSNIEEDAPDSADSGKRVAAAYTITLQIRSMLEEIRSGGKDVDIPTLCNRLKEMSDRDTEKSWTKDIREYLHLLLSGEFLDDDIAKQAVNDLLRNL